MSDIPLARQLLAEALLQLTPGTRPHAAVEAALGVMTRRSPAKPRAPARRKPVNAEDAERIRAFVSTNPNIDIQSLAEALGVNSGRVSEALHHDR